MAGGVGIGLASNISPVYIAEIAPAEVRGRLVSLNQLTIVIGVLLAQCANWVIGSCGDRADARSLAAASPASATVSQAEFANAFIAKYGPRIPAEEISDFMRKHDGRPTDETVLAFLKDNKIKLPASYADLAHRGLLPWNETAGWRWMFGAVTLPGLLLFLAMFVVPESPRWLAKNGRDAQARDVLSKVGGDAFAQRELSEIQATLVNEIQRVDFRELLEPRMRKILVLGVVLAVLQQCCGINCIFYYADKIFAAAGSAPSDILWNVVVMGTVNLAFTLLAIAAVDRVGRKILMVLGSAGLAILFALLGAAFLRRRHRQPDPGTDSRRDGLLLLHARPDHVGDPLGDFPEPHPRGGHVGFGVLALGGLFRRGAVVPDHLREDRALGIVLRLQRHLRLGLLLRPDPAARNQGQDPGRNRKRTGRLSLTAIPAWFPAGTAGR